jgi:hypothetical protein
MLVRAFIVWVLIAALEVIHGYMRVRLLNRRVGDRRARQIAVGTGSLLILGVTALTIPWIGPASPREALAVGGLWLALMLSFEFAFGRLVFHVSWDRLLADFDWQRGGLLSFGMLVLFLAPWLLGAGRGLF